VEEAFGYLDLDWQRYVVQDERFYRPAEVDLLVGDPAKAGKKLGWEPTVDFRQLVRLMVDADLEALSRQPNSEMG
jgi:GDPmannose 4,6-dehydratase